MDLENVPDINLSEEKKKKIQDIVRKSYKEGVEFHKKWVIKMRKAGYSDKEIENMLCY